MVDNEKSTVGHVAQVLELRSAIRACDFRMVEGPPQTERYPIMVEGPPQTERYPIMVEGPPQTERYPIRCESFGYLFRVSHPRRGPSHENMLTSPAGLFELSDPLFWTYGSLFDHS